MDEKIMNKNSIEYITNELDTLIKHVKMYSRGAYPTVFFQLHSAIKLDEILNMKLYDVYQFSDGDIYVKAEIDYEEYTVRLNEEERLELAWYAFQRIPVRNTKKEVLNDFLCVNKKGLQLQKQVYSKMLVRYADELKLSKVYTSSYLRSLYGYLKIAFGKDTVEAVATEYGVEKYYLLTRTFKCMEIKYAQSVIREVAGI